MRRLAFFRGQRRQRRAVPIMRSGKALAAKVREITIFSNGHRTLHSSELCPRTANQRQTACRFAFSRTKGHFSFQASVPDTMAEMRNVEMAFHYDESSCTQSIPKTYERLLLTL